MSSVDAHNEQMHIFQGMLLAMVLKHTQYDIGSWNRWHGTDNDIVQSSVAVHGSEEVLYELCSSPLSQSLQQYLWQVAVAGSDTYVVIVRPSTLQGSACCTAVHICDNSVLFMLNLSL